MIKAKDIKNGNIIELDGKVYRVEVNTSTGEIKLIELPVIKNIKLDFEVLK